MMARIIYGVAGEGFGHSSRSHLIGQHLIEAEHEVLFVASRRSLAYLRKHFGGRVHEIVGLSLVYQDRVLVPLKTVTTNLSRFLSTRRVNHDLYRTVYGFDRDERRGNCEFRRTSTPGFLHDLARCRGIIATAGFSLLSECLHFRKRMLLLPVQGQYEQVINAQYAERLGLALNRTTFDAATLTEYLESVDEPIVDHDEILWPDNAAFLDLLDRTVERICPRPVTVSQTAFADGLFAG